ncbi:uncharacterized protein At4g14450, chloroplastic-like [Malania oleifera]|uniref:uncharacterized protein At4g14450, chloroplastic-like n=1 Tax=Malania oleifera TaxID=397392 RepID=UPI0025ADD4A1|nr:uncharacterized protein At4g14450, chloroplastic-like [Malania oleifera]
MPTTRRPQPHKPTAILRSHTHPFPSLSLSLSFRRIRSMAEIPPRTSVACGSRQSSRLQRRAPASLQISPVSDWKSAIPLLSPLITSPQPLPERNNRAADAKSRDESRPEHQAAEPENIAFKKWQHPAAPFYYEPAPVVRPFVPV